MRKQLVREMVGSFVPAPIRAFHAAVMQCTFTFVPSAEADSVWRATGDRCGHVWNVPKHHPDGPIHNVTTDPPKR